MRIPIAKTSVISRTLGTPLVLWVLFGFLAFCHSDIEAVARSEASWQKSLVRVQLEYESRGVIHGGQLVPRSRVVEITAFAGIVIDARGYIAAYVGDHGPRIRTPHSRFAVQFPDGRAGSAKLLGVDERASLAVFTSEHAKEGVAKLGSSVNRKQLELVSLSEAGWGGFSLCVLHVTEDGLLPRKEIRARLCKPGSRLDAVIGSLVFDESDRFLGFVADVGNLGFSKTVSRYQVIPAQSVNESMRTILERQGDIRAGWLGVVAQSRRNGLLITRVYSDSPAAVAGLLAGDVVLEINQQAVGDLKEFGKAIQWAGPEGTVELTVEREGRNRTVRPVLGVSPSKRQPGYAWAVEVPRVWKKRDEVMVKHQLKLYPVPLPSLFNFGLVVDALTPQLATFFKVPGGQGLLVTSVLEGSLAGETGFKAGDVVVGVNGVEPKSPNDLKEILDSTEVRALTIRFVREGKTLSRKLVVP